ncbi:hypothetical protein P4S72_26995 [Vibrio sp. PP-XX7]
MNLHISDTSAEREPWVWIVELILGEMDAGNFHYPYMYDWVGGELCLLVRTSHIMQHISQTPALKTKFDSLPVKSDRILKKQLKESGVVLKDGYEKTMKGQRVANLVALGVENLREFGLFPTVPEDVREKRRIIHPPDFQAMGLTNAILRRLIFNALKIEHVKKTEEGRYGK